MSAENELKDLACATDNSASAEESPEMPSKVGIDLSLTRSVEAETDEKCASKIETAVSLGSVAMSNGSVSPVTENNMEDGAAESDSLTLTSGVINKKMKPKRDDRKCTVCGDKALGYNFDAITCESCKAFFRRNATKLKIPRCMFQGSCTIDPNTRRFCSACRLDKCLNVGMKKDMILGDDERQKRIEKVKQNRAKKLILLQKQTSVDMVSATDTEKESPQPSSVNGQSEMSKLYDIKVEASSSQPMESLTDPNMWSSMASLMGCNPVPSTLSDDFCSENSQNRLLTEQEKRLIEFMDKCYFSSFGSTDKETPMQPETTSLEALMNHIGIMVKLLIQFAKRLPDFLMIPQAAQVALLKGALVDAITWRSAQYYSIEKGKWVNNEGGEISTQLLNAAFNQVDRSIIHEHIRLITEMKNLIGEDTTLVALIQASVMFTPEYSSPGAQALTASLQEKYLSLLRHYLEANHTWSEAFDKYSKVLNYMSRVKDYSAKHRKVFVNCDASQVEPLLLEMFDILSQSHS